MRSSKPRAHFLRPNSTVPGRGRPGDRAPQGQGSRGRVRLPGAGAVGVGVLRARKRRPKSARRLRDEQLMPLIEQVHAESGGTYGVRRITRALRRTGVPVARCTVERLMRELGLEGVIRGQRRRTTVPEPSAPRPPDLVDRDFTASRPDQLWVADMTQRR
ncbi:IS3 family transposase [Streptomyces anandii]|uniref:IS3 family transposase n=1 Tax=Streptomyces anandii TaxID=285454 RepID=UPI0036F68CCB